VSARSLTQALYLVAAILLVFAFFKHGNTAILSSFEKFISSYQAILTSIGTLLLIGGLAVWTTHLANQAAFKREISNRKLAAELKIADYRDCWIKELREEISEFLSLLSGQIDQNTTKRMKMLSIKLKLRLDQRKAASKDILASIERILALAEDGNQEDIIAEQSKLQDQVGGLLHRQWDKLKTDLEVAQNRFF
jgi:hypothetical protein